MQLWQHVIRMDTDARVDARDDSREADLVLVFGAARFFSAPDFLPRLRAAFPKAAWAGCSTAGEITREGLSEESCLVTAIRFDHTAVRVVDAQVANMEGSRAAGEALGEALTSTGLAGVLVFGVGLQINGSELIEGLTTKVGPKVPVSGGLAGDGGAFKQTWVVSSAGLSDRGVVAVGLYGNQVQLGHGSFGGWEPFGPARKITRATGNILYELDGESALDIYKRYLGDYARDLPGSGLLFPLEILNEHHASMGLIRTILGIDAEKGSLILAGAIEENGYLRLMHANTDGLVHGARQAAGKSMEHLGGQPRSGQGLAILVSCVGRKLVMGDLVDDEIVAVVKQVGEAFAFTGFYSYGEICPMDGFQGCKLHNQTMTVTLVSEN
ncbi:MAG: FIST C-terminal domain-containing protein [Magnetococcales bacterium]|nr:FIST C-terminal domain-containing protein [Magnetococcales bacterium]